MRAWQADGITPGSVMGCMCRNHRGLVLTMLAAAKNGTKLVLMNTGFARPQLVDVAAREQVQAFVYDDEFHAVAEALPTRSSPIAPGRRTIRRPRSAHSTT